MTTHATPHPSAPVRRRLRVAPALTLPVVLTGTFMVVLDFFIVNVALPSVQSGLHATGAAIEWVVAGYALTTAVLLIPAARLGDRYGRRRMFCAGLALFTIASLLCGVAATAGELVGARLLQGAGGALLMPNVLAIINVTFDGPERVRALSLYGLSMGVAAVGGQLLGGALIALNPGGVGWRACFLVNVPVGALALVLAPRVLGESRDPGAESLDLLGAGLLTGALTAVVLPLVQGRSAGWPAWTWVSLALAPALGVVFLGHQRRRAALHRTCLIEPSLLRARPLRRGLVAQLAFWAGQASFFMVLALYLQQGRGLSALQSGLVFTILAASYLAASLRSAALAMRHGPRVLGAAGLTLGAGHALVLGAVAFIGTAGSVLALAPGLVLEGAGMGLAITPLTTLLLSAAPPEHVGGASGLLSTTQQVGAALGVAVIGAIFFGAVPSGLAHAFELSLIALSALVLALAPLSRLLPAPRVPAS
jgi:EmrB/QacA subfamily drug resistance transporter